MWVKATVYCGSSIILQPAFFWLLVVEKPRYVDLIIPFSNNHDVLFSKEPKQLHNWFPLYLLSVKSCCLSLHITPIYSHYVNPSGLMLLHICPSCMWLIYVKVKLSLGRAIAEAVSRWLPTAAARVQSRVWSSGICGGRSGAGAGFLRVVRFPLPFIPPNSPSSQSPGAGTISQ
jgi:hypothetical protein